MPAVTWPNPYVAGQIITADQINQFFPLFAIKPSTTAIASSTTQTSDPHLTLSVLSGATYTIDAWYLVSGVGSTTLGNFATRFSHPGGTISWAAAGMEPAALSSAGKAEGTGEWLGNTGTAGTTPIQTYATPTNQLGITVRGSYLCTADGTLAVQWAQGGSSATPSNLVATSWLKLERVA